jgi:pimeloyl-ACP methyl ester carboxylesterase
VKRASLGVVTPDGRRLAVEVAGPEDGDVVVYHTGTPGAGSLYTPLLEAGAERGLRHVSYARPGYGGSDRQPGRTIADCAHDVAAIADALGVERFYTTGHSGGGPHALACAAMLPDRVSSAATTAGVAPFDAEGLDWLAGMGQENLDEFAAQEAGDSQLQAFLERSAEEFGSLSGDQVIAALGDLISEALRNGIWGWFDDDKATVADWGFDLAGIEAPVTIWQGEEDRMVPFAHGKWLADHVSGAKARLLAGEGHLSLEVGSYGAVLDDLVASRA